MTAEHWFAARRYPDRVTRRLRGGQPASGFADVREVMEWLEAAGRIGPAVDTGDGIHHDGWGDPYCAVAGSRDDPWEEPPALELVDGP